MVTAFNHDAEIIYEYDAEEVIGRSIIMLLVAPGRWQEMEAIIDGIKLGKWVHHFETRGLRKDGTIIDLSMTVSPIWDGSGRLSGPCGTSARVSKGFPDAFPTLQMGCVISDLRMPNIDGLGLRRRPKELGSGLPLIFITGNEISAAVRAMKAGAMDFIENPFDNEPMPNAVQTAFSYHRPEGEEKAAHDLHFLRFANP